jgi:hypothetical protein
MTMPLFRVDGVDIRAPQYNKPRSRPATSIAVPVRPKPAPVPPPPTPRQTVSTSPAPIPRVTPKPKPPSISKFLAGDEIYQQALRAGQASLEDILSEIARRRAEANVNFEQASRLLETDRERQLERLRNEFAARGLLHSSLFAQEQGTFQQDFMTAMQQLEQQRQQLLQDLIAQQTAARRRHELEMEAARQEALARRAERYNIPL